MDKDLQFQFEYVRREGRYNMMDQNGVANRANALGFHKLVVAASDRSSYGNLLMKWDTPDKEEYYQWVCEQNLADEDSEEGE